MSIETLLTLGLTAALLVAAFVLRVVILGSLRLGLRLAGRDTSWTRPQVVGSTGSNASEAVDRPAPVRRKRPLLTPGTGGGIGTALRAASATVLAVAATAWTATVRGAEGLERWADRTSESLAPAMRDITSAARRSTRDIGKYLVAGIATVQHVVLLLAGWVRGIVTETRPNDAARRSTQPQRKVIDLDLDLDDDPLGSSRTSRSRISV